MVSDVFSKPNLEPKAEPWGREVTNRLRDAGYSAISFKANFESQARAFAGTLTNVINNNNKLAQIAQELQAGSNALQVGSDLLQIGSDGNQDFANEVDNITSTLASNATKLNTIQNNLDTSVTELESRKTVSVSVPNTTNSINPTPGGSTLNYSNSTNFSIPASPDGANRHFIFFMTAPSYHNAPSSDQIQSRNYCQVSPSGSQFRPFGDEVMINPFVGAPPIDPAFNAIITGTVGSAGINCSFELRGEATRVDGSPSTSRTFGFRNIQAYVRYGDKV